MIPLLSRATELGRPLFTIGLTISHWSGEPGMSIAGYFKRRATSNFLQKNHGSIFGDSY